MGIKPWDSESTSRYRRKANNQADKASRFCDAVMQEFPDNDELVANVSKARKERLTTIGRLISDPAVAHAFGFRITTDDVLFDFESGDLLAGLEYIFRGMSTPGESSVANIMNKPDRLDYINRATAASSVPDPGQRLANPRLPGGSSTTSKPDPSQSPGPGDPKHGGGAGIGTSKLPKVEANIFQSLKLRHFSTRTQHLLRSAQKIKIDEATPVCAVMIRIVLEMALTEVGVGQGWFDDSEKLNKKFRRALLQLDPDCQNSTKRNKLYDHAWTGSQVGDGGGIAVERMNSWVHNVMAYPLPADVRGNSLGFRPLLEGLDAFLAAP